MLWAAVLYVLGIFVTRALMEATSVIMTIRETIKAGDPVFHTQGRFITDSGEQLVDATWQWLCALAWPVVGVLCLLQRFTPRDRVGLDELLARQSTGSVSSSSPSLSMTGRAARRSSSYHARQGLSRR